jgi:hypothetical protein
MKLRDAAAFALVGWYLMVPPFKRKSYLGADIHAAQLGLLLIHRTQTWPSRCPSGRK